MKIKITLIEQDEEERKEDGGDEGRREGGEGAEEEEEVKEMGIEVKEENEGKKDIEEKKNGKEKEDREKESEENSKEKEIVEKEKKEEEKKIKETEKEKIENEGNEKKENEVKEKIENEGGETKENEGKEKETEGKEKKENEEITEFSEEYLQSMNDILSQQSLGTVLEWCCHSLPNFFQITSFGASGMVIIHELSKLNLKLPVIFLDTLYHFAETLEHAKAVETKYGLQMYWYRCPQASTRDEFEKVFKSDDMWISHPRRFEWLTKVEPLERALAEHKVGAWITGRRREQGALRTQMSILEVDVDGRIKVNPLAYWTREEVWAYLSREGVPYNPLFDQSYASIGDTVTTTQTTDISLGERAGRFFQFGGTKTECGIHVRRPLPDVKTSNQANEVN